MYDILLREQLEDAVLYHAIHAASPVVAAALALLLSAFVAGCAPEPGSAPDAQAQAGGSPQEQPDGSSAQTGASSSDNKDLPFESIPQEALISTEDLKSMIDQGRAPFILDVRSSGAYYGGYIEGSKNIPAGRQLDLRMNEIPRDRDIAIVSSDTRRLAEVRQTLIDNGFDAARITVVEDGMDGWVANGYPVLAKKVVGC